MSIQTIISFFESHKFANISAELRKLKKKDATDYHKVKQFLFLNTSRQVLQDSKERSKVLLK